MSVSNVPSPVTQFLDANGVPLADGSVLTCIPGTYNLVTTYQDYLGTVPNSNPIILDGSGSCQIFYTGGSSIRLILSDVNNVQIFDGVSDVPTSGAGTLLASNNLSDLTSVPTAILNLGLGTAALINTGTANSTVGLLNANKTDSGNNTYTGSDAFTKYLTIGAGASNSPQTIPLSTDVGYLGTPVVGQTGNYTASWADVGNFLLFSANAVITLPANSVTPINLGLAIRIGFAPGFSGTVTSSDSIYSSTGNAVANVAINSGTYVDFVKTMLTTWYSK